MTPEEIAALYTRTSQEKDDAFTIDSQIKAGRQSAITNGLVVRDGYEFREDFTGKTLDRPELNKLRELIKQKKITAVIIYAVDRLARKIGVADILLDEFMDSGIKLFIVSWGTYVKDTPEDRLRFNFEATFSDFERRKIAERTDRGKQTKLKDGLYLGTGDPPYGYRKVGKKREMRLEIIADQAEVIIRIFTYYAVERLSVLEICKRLEGIPSPADVKGYYPQKVRGSGQWVQPTIYNILKNYAYSGRMTLYGTTIDVPAIVEPDLFARAQQRLAEGRQMSKRSQKYEYLMARRLRCTTCNYSIHAIPSWKKGVVKDFYYRCPSEKAGMAKPKCDLPGFRVHQVDEIFWNFVREILLDPPSLRLMMEESQKEMQERNADLMMRLYRIKERIEKERKRLAILLAEYTEMMSEEAEESEARTYVQETYKKAKEDAQQLFAELVEERDKLEAQLQGTMISDELIDDLEEFAKTIRDDIDSLPFQGRRELIESLGIFGELALEDEQRVVYIVWHVHRVRKVLTLSPSAESPSARARRSRSAASRAPGCVAPPDR